MAQQSSGAFLRILWNGIDHDGFKFTDHVPQELRRTDNREMLLEHVNGSLFQVIAQHLLS